MRIVFMGTPDIAAQILESLITSNEDNNVVGVFTQPDRPAGRGKKIQYSSAKALALEHSISVYQPESMKTTESQELLRSLNPDVLVVAAYGMILPQEVLDIPKLGAYNVHTSLLPKYRGAAPVQRCLIQGDKFTGVTIMRIEIGLDSGPILLQQAMEIKEDDNAATLLHALGKSGARLMLGALRMLNENRAAFIEQNHEIATYAHKLTKQEAVIDWTQSAKEIHNHVRGFSPNPGATTNLYMQARDAIAVRIENGKDLSEQNIYESGTLAQAGHVLGIHDDMLCIACGEGVYGIQSLRLAGKASVDIKTFKNGYKQYLESMYFAPTVL